MAEALIELRDVDVALNGATVLRDVTWSLQRGEHWMIRGGNGSGKSTFLRLLRGEVWPAPNRGIRIYRLDGSTQKTDGGGSIACGAAPGAAGCIGFGWWEKESAYEATVWDLKQAKSAGSVGTNVTGTSAIIGAVVPIPFIARVQSAACDRMADQLRSFFTETDSPAAASTAATTTTRGKKR